MDNEKEEIKLAKSIAVPDIEPKVKALNLILQNILMSRLQSSAIKEIAREIAMGNTCYIHRYTAVVTIIDNSTKDSELIMTQEQTQADIDKKIENYIKIEKLSSENQLVIMKLFLEEIPDRSVRKQLSNALNRKNPVRNFNQTIESDIVLNQHWMNFKFEEYQRWISNFVIDAYNY